eukprot:CAMPEP_0171955880 /NCGR_PEP_ID=MMETSP0993-20121228/116788_1 /TAXON_ID=483369 /ORGANISM="non described non described, Strain CCMP2098" /LENGTH=32 /DNA_ID= /DNA_START= /DNA_END= /DNA_ORIENTATION=
MGGANGARSRNVTKVLKARRIDAKHMEGASGA